MDLGLAPEVNLMSLYGERGFKNIHSSEVNLKLPPPEASFEQIFGLGSDKDIMQPVAEPSLSAGIEDARSTKESNSAAVRSSDFFFFVRELPEIRVDTHVVKFAKIPINSKQETMLGRDIRIHDPLAKHVVNTEEFRQEPGDHRSDLGAGSDQTPMPTDIIESPPLKEDFGRNKVPVGSDTNVLTDMTRAHIKIPFQPDTTLFSSSDYPLDHTATYVPSDQSEIPELEQASKPGEIAVLPSRILVSDSEDILRVEWPTVEAKEDPSIRRMPVEQTQGNSTNVDIQKLDQTQRQHEIESVTAFDAVLETGPSALSLTHLTGSLGFDRARPARGVPG